MRRCAIKMFQPFSEFYPTVFADINKALHALCEGILPILDRQLIGIILHGSLASGDFHPNRSDLDVVVVTAGELNQNTFNALKKMHTSLTASSMKWTKKMEVSYIPKEALQKYDPAQSIHPALRVDGSFELDGHGRDWIIQRYLIRTYGIALFGPSPAELIDPVEPEEVRQAVRDTLADWWAPMLKDPARIHDAEYQAYAVLTMCRALYTLQHGMVASKPVSARWAIAYFDEKWSPVIKAALAWENGQSFDQLDQVLSFIRHTLVQAKVLE